MKQHYLPALLCLILGGAASGKTVVTNTAANLVLGKPNFVTSISPVTNSFSLDSPTSIVIDPVSRKVFVSDADNNRILRYPDVNSLTNGAGAEAVLGQTNFSTGGGAGGPFGLSSPAGIFLDRFGRLWVADSLNHRVLVYEAAVYRASNTSADRVFGQPNFTTVTLGTSATKMSRPFGVFVDSADRLWVAEFGNNRVLRFDSISTKASGAAANGVLGQSDFLTATGGAGSKFNGPEGISVSAGGALFVGDADNARVLRFDNAASLANGAGPSAVLGQPDFVTTTSTLTATGVGRAVGAFITPDDTLWVCDQSNHRVLRYDKASTKANGAAANAVVGQPNFTSAVFQTTNRGLSNPFSQPFVDAGGNLWVTEIGNDRVLRFPPDATKPLLTVTTTIPKTVSNAKFTIKGTASDASGITKVQYKVNNGAVKTATGTTNWQFKANLASGKNTITIFAIDAANNQSINKVLKIKRTSGVAPHTLVLAE